MISQITASNFQSPETVPAAKAVVKEINAAGGLGGHPINLTTCDDKEDPTTAGSCARTAAQSHAVAVVVGISLMGGTMDPIFQASGIPAVASPTTPTDTSNPNVYATDGGTLALWGGTGALLAKSSCSRIGVLYDSTSPVGAQGPPAVAAAVATSGTAATVVAKIGVSEASTDLKGAVSDALAKNADCIASTMTPALNVAALKAISQSSKPDIPVGFIGPGFPLVVASQVGAIAKHVLIDSAQYLPGDPHAADFTDLMQKAGIAPTSFAANVYIGFHVLQAALKNHTGALTAKDVKAALDSSSGLIVPLLPKPVQYSKPFPAKAYARLTNLAVACYAFDGKKFVPLTGGRAVFDLTPALKKVAG